MARVAVRFEIEGRVQGVGYRWWAVETARRLGVTGWVRNRRDGSVEILALGEPDALETLARACGEGPSGARVTIVRRVVGVDDGSEAFEQRPTP